MSMVLRVRPVMGAGLLPGRVALSAATRPPTERAHVHTGEHGRPSEANGIPRAARRRRAPAAPRRRSALRGILDALLLGPARGSDTGTQVIEVSLREIDSERTDRCGVH